MTDTRQNKLEITARAISSADAYIVCTGAGLGVDSGLATFRGPTAKG